jgi:hypothetical protein
LCLAHINAVGARLKPEKLAWNCTRHKYDATRK